MWLRPIGLVLLFVAPLAVRGEQHACKNVKKAILFLVLIMSLIFVGVFSPERAASSWRPRLWYATVLGMLWAVSLLIETKRWLKARTESPNPNSSNQQERGVP
jgi:cell division protein FtsW (lipid II flippase)